MPDVILCKWCGVRPARPAEFKWGHYRCSQCRHERFRASRAQSQKQYLSKASVKEQDRVRQRLAGKRKLRWAGRTIMFPTAELKQHAAALIRQRRQEFRQRVTKETHGPLA